MFLSRPLFLHNERLGDTIEGRFVFDPPLDLRPGVVRVQIYRTGGRSYENYYAIDPEVLNPIVKMKGVVRNPLTTP